MSVWITFQVPKQLHLHKYFMTLQGSHFSGLTKFPDFSLTFPVFFAIFPVFFNVLFFLTENLIHFTKKCTVHLNITKNIK